MSTCAVAVFVFKYLFLKSLLWCPSHSSDRLWHFSLRVSIKSKIMWLFSIHTMENFFLKNVAHISQVEEKKYETTAGILKNFLVGSVVSQSTTVVYEHEFRDWIGTTKKQHPPMAAWWESGKQVCLTVFVVCGSNLGFGLPVGSLNVLAVMSFLRLPPKLENMLLRIIKDSKLYRCEEGINVWLYMLISIMLSHQLQLLQSAFRSI